MLHHRTACRSVPVDTLSAIWRDWAEDNGVRPVTKQMFGRNLLSVVPQLNRMCLRERPRRTGDHLQRDRTRQLVRIYIRLRRDSSLIKKRQDAHRPATGKGSARAGRPHEPLSTHHGVSAVAVG